MFCCSLFHRTRIVVVLAAVVLFALPSEAKSHSSRATSATRSSKSHGKTSAKKGAHSKKVTRKGAWKHHGQQAIQETRATQIQQALIREHYLDSAATGNWNSKTEDAMRKYQADNGWQTKVVPDSRAIIKLGLGPSNDGLINPEHAATATATSAQMMPAGSPTATNSSRPIKRQ